ncbi:MAG: hypothetical protein CL840_09925 [Crocinitomicaceae bacterium]|nr:hypothetical protein [Crocinitomicaceae bacterium]|tara:strand:- start:3461 stop:4315 length:855 start_codon:yes stop_codon:yes gene_type:complete
MRQIKSVLDFFVFSNIYVALPVSALAWSTFLLFGSKVNFDIVIFIYCSTLFIYNVHRIVGLHKIETQFLSPRHTWALKNKGILYLGMFLAAAGSLFLLNRLEITFLYVLLPSGIIAFGYSVPIIKRNGKYWRLRDLPFAKVFLISLTVSYVTVYLPLYEYAIIDWSNLTILGFFCTRFLFILAITIPFDIRDIDFDAPSSLNTLPLLFGVEKARKLSIIFLSLFAGLVLFLFQSSTFSTLALLLSALFTAWIVSYAKKESGEYYYSLLVEGTMIIQFGLVWLVS